MEEEGKYNWLEIACNLQLLDSHSLSMANEFSPVSLGALLFFAVVMIEGTQWTAIFYVNVNTRLERNCFQHSRNIFIFTSTQNFALLIKILRNWSILVEDFYIYNPLSILFLSFAVWKSSSNFCVVDYIQFTQNYNNIYSTMRFEVQHVQATLLWQHDTYSN